MRGQHTEFLRLNHGIGLLRQTFAGLCALLFLTLGTTMVSAEPQSIMDFMARKEGWDGLTDRLLDLEGRGGSQIGNSLKMKECDLKFVLPEGAMKPDSFPSIRLTGKLVKIGRNYEFQVQQLLSWKDDLAIVDEKLRLGDTTKAETFDTVADWAEKRGEFYKDDLLLDRSRRVREDGIRRALQDTPIEQVDEFLRLSKKGTTYHLAPAIQEECLFSATWGERTLRLREEKPQFSTLLANISSRFPSAKTPLDEFSEDGQKKFATLTPQSYRSATPLERQMIHRQFYVDTARRLVEQEAAADGSDGFKMAARLEALAPELAPLAENYRQKELDFLLGRVDKMSRDELMQFSRRLLDLQDLERDATARSRWMAHRKKLLETGRIDQIDLADDTHVVLNDTKQTIALLGEVLLQEPTNAAALERIDKLGFTLNQGRVMAKSDTPKPMEDPFRADIEAGRVAIGMSASQVRQSFGGAPDRVARMITRDANGVLWEYVEIGTTVFLEVRSSDRQLVVSRVMHTPRIEEIPIPVPVPIPEKKTNAP
ncbi:MAG: hypothetical protein R3C01_13045 [Planctomycetaceae bacterium]